MPRKTELIEQIMGLEDFVGTAYRRGKPELAAMTNSALMEERQKLREQVPSEEKDLERLVVETGRVMIAVDPGDAHVGVAVFSKRECVWAGEMTPAGFLAWLRLRLDDGTAAQVVVEEFRLYSWMAEKQSWSDFPTAQLIGAIKAAVAWFGGQVNEVTGERIRDKEVGVVMQPASIKKITRAQLEARGIKSQAKARKAGGHAADAELHGWHWLLRRREAVAKAKGAGAGVET